MSKIQTNSTISLAQVAGLIKNLMEMLVGPKGRIWLEAFKRFLRKESAWNFELVLRIKVEQNSANLYDVFPGIRKLGFSIFPRLEEISKNERPVFYYPNARENIFDVVAVRLADLIPFDKIGVWGYREIKAKALRCGFGIPSRDHGLVVGLLAATKIATQKAGEYDCLVLSEVISQPNEKNGLPYVHKGHVGSGSPKGIASVVDLDSCNALKNPETILILFWKD